MDKMRRDNAIVNLTRITVCPENRKELFQTISSLIDPVKREEGCLTYGLYEESGDENTFALIGEWTTTDAWNDHLHSDNFAILLGSLSLLCYSSQFEVKLLSHIANIEALTRERIECHKSEIQST